MMNICELKTTIEANGELPQLLVFIADKDNFIVSQYRHAFANQNNLEIKFVDNLNDIPCKSLFSSFSKTLFFYEVDELTDDLSTNLDGYVWVVCRKNPKNVSKDLVVKIPKLERWQVEDYVKTQCKGVSEEKLDTLLKLHNYNIHSLHSEVDKLSVFAENERDTVFDLIRPQLINHIDYTVFDLINSINKKDINKVNEIFNYINLMDVDCFGLLRLLITNFKRIIDIQLHPNSSAEYVGVSDKQFWAIKKYSCGFYTKNQLVSIYKFLLDIDYRIKSGLLDTSLVIDYVIYKILYT